MDAAYVNAFIQGAQNILNTICAESPRLGKLFMKKYPYISEIVSISFDIFKDITGNVVFTMKPEVACFIASKMMYGMPVSALDDMSISAICELGNMISGNVATIFSKQGTMVDISTPSFRMNAASGDFPFIKENSQIVCVPLVFSTGDVFEINIFKS